MGVDLGVLMRKRVSIVVTVSQQCSIILWAEGANATLNHRN